MHKEPVYWPSYRYHADGRAEIFQREEDVPEGWHDNPAKAAAATTPEIAPKGPRTAPTATQTREVPIVRPVGSQPAVVTLEDEDDLPPAVKEPKKLGKGSKAVRSEAREEAVRAIREGGIKIADDATDGEIEVALAKLGD